MSRLILIRHAQASFSRDARRAFHDYDRLSPLGVTQADALGGELVASGTIFDRVCVGPARRHRQTAEAVASAYARSDAPWPVPATVEEFAEHHGARVVERALDDPGDDEELVRLRAMAASGEHEGERTRMYFRAFRRITRRWARGELPARLGGEEDWASFRSRVERGVRSVLEACDPGETVGMFTSGGPVGSTVAWALGLSDEVAMELAWTVQNATLTELRFRDGRASLRSFNTQPRLGTAELHTHV